MGELATRVQERIRDHLAAECPGYDWATEYDVAGTPVDVVGDADRDDGRTVALVELEWRRADPADNTAKLFRHLSAGVLDADGVVVCQVFTGYYDLATGGVSSKRLNAEFVGRVAADALDGLSYDSVDLDLDPPKRGGNPPENWQDGVDIAAARVVDCLS